MLSSADLAFGDARRVNDTFMVAPIDSVYDPPIVHTMVNDTSFQDVWYPKRKGTASFDEATEFLLSNDLFNKSHDLRVRSERRHPKMPYKHVPLSAKNMSKSEAHANATSYQQQARRDNKKNTKAKKNKMSWNRGKFPRMNKTETTFGSDPIRLMTLHQFEDFICKELSVMELPPYEQGPKRERPQCNKRVRKTYIRALHKAMRHGIRTALDNLDPAHFLHAAVCNIRNKGITSHAIKNQNKRNLAYLVRLLDQQAEMIATHSQVHFGSRPARTPHKPYHQPRRNPVGRVPYDKSFHHKPCLSSDALNGHPDTLCHPCTAPASKGAPSVPRFAYALAGETRRMHTRSTSTRPVVETVEEEEPPPPLDTQAPNVVAPEGTADTRPPRDLFGRQEDHAPGEDQDSVQPPSDDARPGNDSPSPDSQNGSNANENAANPEQAISPQECPMDNQKMKVQTVQPRPK